MLDGIPGVLTKGNSGDVTESLNILLYTEMSDTFSN